MDTEDNKHFTELYYQLELLKKETKRTREEVYEELKEQNRLLKIENKELKKMISTYNDIKAIQEFIKNFTTVFIKFNKKNAA